MNYLAIDTSGKSLCVVLSVNGETEIYRDEDCGVAHSVRLMPQIEKMLEEKNFSLKNADFIACVVGAGSFTGIRIGVSTVKALCFAYGKPCLSITSFDTLAYNKQSGKVLAVIDAKHNGYYVCGYNNGKVCYPPEYVLKEKLEELAKEYEIVSQESLDDFNTLKVNTAQGLIRAIEDKKDCVTYQLNDLIPLYVRKSQAEEGR